MKIKFDIRATSIALIIEVALLNFVLASIAGNNIHWAFVAEMWLLPFSAVLIPLAAGCISGGGEW